MKGRPESKKVGVGPRIPFSGSRLCAQIRSADRSLVAPPGSCRRVTTQRGGDRALAPPQNRGDRRAGSMPGRRLAGMRRSPGRRAAGGLVLVTTIAKQGIRCFIRRSKDQALGVRGACATNDGDCCPRARSPF